VQVNVSVNGHLIPFNMKIGEAGEAFFVFETEGDVPEDLITSPILHPTRPDEPKQPDIPAVAQSDGGPLQQEAEVKEETLEPEFLDLNALPSTSNHPPSSSLHDRSTPDQRLPSPPLTPTANSYFHSATPSSFFLDADKAVDPSDAKLSSVLKKMEEDIRPPDVQYTTGPCS
jgi:phosphatidate phosphatase LPIN